MHIFEIFLFIQLSDDSNVNACELRGLKNKAKLSYVVAKQLIFRIDIH